MITALKPQAPELTVCSYCNQSPQIQIVRISNIPSWTFERVVFPYQQLVFEAPEDAHLEVHTSEIASAIQSDGIPCHLLRVKSTSAV